MGGVLCEGGGWGVGEIEKKEKKGGGFKEVKRWETWNGEGDVVRE